MEKGYKWPERRVKFVKLDPFTLGKMLIDAATYQVESQIPADAHCMGARIDVHDGSIVLLFASEEFDVVETGSIVPELSADSIKIIDIESVESDGLSIISV